MKCVNPCMPTYDRDRGSLFTEGGTDSTGMKIYMSLYMLLLHVQRRNILVLLCGVTVFPYAPVANRCSGVQNRQVHVRIEAMDSRQATCSRIPGPSDSVSLNSVDIVIDDRVFVAHW